MATELTEAVLSASGAAALIQKQIDPVVQELQRRYAPLVRVLPSIRWGSTIYNFNQRSQVAAGGFVTDGGARPISTSTYNQYSFTIKNLQSVGGVTGYAEAVTADLIGSLRAKEIEGASTGSRMGRRDRPALGQRRLHAERPLPPVRRSGHARVPGHGFRTERHQLGRYRRRHRRRRRPDHLRPADRDGGSERGRLPRRGQRLLLPR